MPGDSNIVETLNPFVALLISACALAAVCGEGLYRRKYRQSVWIGAPEKLLANPAAANLAATVGGLAGVISAVAWLPMLYQSAWSPVGLALSGLAILGCGQFLASAGIGFAGLLTVGAAVAAIPAAWCGATLIGPMVGWILAAGWMLWLAKFWDQQLDDGRAWTTTGALIPMARGAALVFAAALLGQSIAHTINSAPRTQWTVEVALMLLLFGLIVVFWRSARRHRSIASAVGLWLTVWAMSVLGSAERTDSPMTFCMYSALTLSAMTNQLLRTPAETTVVHLVVARFVLPSFAALLFLLQPFSSGSHIGLAFAAMGVLAGFWLVRGEPPTGGAAPHAEEARRAA